MLKRITVTGALLLSVIMLSMMVGSSVARADAGHANNITPTAMANADSGEVPLYSGQSPLYKGKIKITLTSNVKHKSDNNPQLTPPPAKPPKVKWTPKRQAKFQIEHDYRKYGWTVKGQFAYLRYLWNRESRWHKNALNPYSGAYGIAQALGHGNSSTAACGRNAYGGLDLSSSEARRANCGTSAFQIKWGLRYILDVYGSPKNAWEHETAYGWYISTVHEAMIKFDDKMVLKMAKHIGLKKYTGSYCMYNWGGTGPCSSGFDCSGLVYRTSNNLGQSNIPRTANDIMHWDIPVSHSELLPGDLIFYGSGDYASHVAIYAGHGRALEALSSGNPVGFWSVTYPGQPIGYGRIPYTWNPNTKF